MENLNETEVVKLSFPIKIDGAEVKEFTVRRPKVRDRLIVDKSAGSDAEKEIALLSNLAGITPKDMEDVDLRDYQKLAKVLENFMASE